MLSDTHRINTPDTYKPTRSYQSPHSPNTSINNASTTKNTENPVRIKMKTPNTGIRERYNTKDSTNYEEVSHAVFFPPENARILESTADNKLPLHKKNNPSMTYFRKEELKVKSNITKITDYFKTSQHKVTHPKFREKDKPTIHTVNKTNFKGKNNQIKG